MNLYFRLIGLLIKLLFAKRQHPLEVCEQTFRVWPNDLDLNMHVNNGRYLTIMDLGRCDLMGKVGLMKPAYKKRWLPVLGGAQIYFIRSLKPFQKFKLTTQVVYWDEKWIYLEQQFYYKDKLMASAYVKALFLCKGHKIHPQEVLDEIEHDLVCPQPPKKLLQWIVSDMA